jgi:hypothetical protein
MALLFIKEVVVSLFYTARDFTEVKCEEVKNYIHSFDYERVLLNALLAYNKIHIFINGACKNVYDRSRFVRNVHTLVNYTGLFLVALVMDRRIEPLESNWLALSTLYKKFYSDMNFSYVYNDYYTYLHKKLPFEKSIDEFCEFFESAKANSILENSAGECLVTMKHGDFYVHRIFTRYNYVKPDLSKTEKSNIEFLNIEYMSEGLVSPLILKLDKEHFMVGNEILSMAFVKRLIEYQVRSDFFDDAYTLSIMDNNVDTFELSYDEYILVEKDGYKIIKQK